MKSKTVAALAVFTALLITAVAGVAMTPATAVAAPGITTLAGAPGVVGTVNATGTAARFQYPRGVAVDGNGNVYVADTNASVIRKITPAGVVTTFAGTANANGFVNGTGAAARFNFPEGVACDTAGNVYVADTQNNAIRVINTAGVVATISGQLGVGGFGGYVDGAVGVAMFKHLRGICVAANGTIYVGDSGNDAVRKITAGVVSTLAGGLGVFNNPRGVAVDAAGNVYVADFNNHRIARITAAGVVTTFAGSTTGLSGSTNATGTAARFNNPDGLGRAPSGNLYVGDSGNNTIRLITPAGVVTTFAGSPPPTAAGSADGVNASARFNDPRGVAVNGTSVFIADRGNSTIRKSVGTVLTITATAGLNGTITPAGVMGVASGGSMTFTITPNINYTRASVLVDGVSQGPIASYTFTNVTVNHTISATFTFLGFQITSSAGANGTISPLGNTNVVTGGSQAYTITPALGYHILDVLVDNVSNAGAISTGTYTFTNVTAIHTIAATFAINTFAITTTPGANGTITPANPLVNYGANQTFAIAGNAGYHVLNVVVDAVSQGPIASYTFTNVTAVHTISATFEANPAITVTVPVGTEVWPSGTPQNLGWTLSSAVSYGQFGVWLVNQTTGTWYDAGFYAAVPAQTTYTPSFSTSGIPAGSYRAVVYYRTDPTVWVWQANGVSPGAATITAGALTINVTVPNGTEIWVSGTPQTLGWTVSPAVSVGQFGVWLVNQTTGAWYDAGYYAAVPVQTTYTPGFSTSGIPAGSYKAVVYYRTDPTVWVWQANATSPGAATIL